MDSPQNRDIAMRQHLLYVGGKSTLPPPHIVQQQRSLSHHEFASKTRLLISTSHREKCPLCRHRCFIFHQPRFNNTADTDNDNDINRQPPNDANHDMTDAGTFLCAHCSNAAIQQKLVQIGQLRRDVEQYSRRIQPILHQKLHQTPTTIYRDKILHYKQHQQRITSLRAAVQRQQQENASLNAAMDRLRNETQLRRTNLQQLSPKMGHKWQHALHEYSRKIRLYENKQNSAQQTCTHQSLKLVLELEDFFKIKVLPSMRFNDGGGEHCKLSMIQNIAIPSVFKIRHIQSFYKDDRHELFRFPVPPRKPALHIRTSDAPFIVPSQSLSPPTMPLAPARISSTAQHPSSTTSLHRYATISLRSSQRTAKMTTARQSSPSQKIVNSLTSSPLQRYIPRLTNSISSFLTPPALKQRRGNYNYGQACKESRSLPKNLDDLVLPPTFFNDDDDLMATEEHSSDAKTSTKQPTVRGRSQSLETVKTTKKTPSSTSRASKRLIHEPHIEHGICAALHYIVSFVQHASKYLNIQLLYKMGLYRRNKRNKFTMHTWIERKGRYYRLYWSDTDHTLHEEKDDHNGGNILEFQHALHLLDENINDLCVKCGVHFIKLYPFQFIDNLNVLLLHLRQKLRDADGMVAGQNVQHQLKKTVHSRHSHSHKNPRWKDSYKPSYKKLESVNIIANYDGGAHDDGDHEAKSNQRHTQLSTTMLREKSASNSSSLSASGSITAVNNSESDIVVTPPGQSDHEDWDFVDLTS